MRDSLGKLLCVYQTVVLPKKDNFTFWRVKNLILESQNILLETLIQNPLDSRYYTEKCQVKGDQVLILSCESVINHYSNFNSEVALSPELDYFEISSSYSLNDIKKYIELNLNNLYRCGLCASCHI